MVNPSTGLAIFVKLTSSINVVRVTLRKREAINRRSIASPGSEDTRIISSLKVQSNCIGRITP
jgi:hypothetical protein